MNHRHILGVNTAQFALSLLKSVLAFFFFIIYTQKFMASSSTASSRISNSCFDVFISHRGPEVKKTLASHLYHHLLSHGFWVFLDHEELEEGQNLNSQIEGAIATASVQVAIFSPRYAESKWCLDKLLLILKSGYNYPCVLSCEVFWASMDSMIEPWIFMKRTACKTPKHFDIWSSCFELKI